MMSKRLVVLAVLVLAALTPASADSFVINWSLSPESDISGFPGQTVGWGYQISNPNAGVWVAVESLGTPLFNVGVPTQLINMSAGNAPVLGPGESATQPFDPVLNEGLLGFFINSNAPGGALDSGLFTLTFDLYDANPLDPLSNANLIEVLDVSQPFSVGVEGAIIPEPGGWQLILGGALLLTGVHRRVRVRREAQ